MRAGFAQGVKLLDESIAKSFGHGFGFGMDLKFVIDIFDVKTDRVITDFQFRRRRFVVVSFGCN